MVQQVPVALVVLVAQEVLAALEAREVLAVLVAQEVREVQVRQAVLVAQEVQVEAAEAAAEVLPVHHPFMVIHLEQNL